MRAIDPPLVPPLVASEAVRASVEACLLDGTWARYDPDRLERVEKRISEYLGIGHALLLGSGTLGIELGLHALGVKPGGVVAMPALDYPGNFLTIHALGAKPLLVDVRPDSPQMCAESLESALGEAKGKSQPIQAVLVSHLYGGMADVEAIGAVCKRHGVPWLEDACQCLGGRWENGGRLGTFGDVGVYSLGGGKPLSIGRGGVLVTAHAQMRQKALLRVSRGSAMAVPSVLQLAALEPQLDTHDQALRHRAEEIIRCLEILGKTENSQLKWGSVVEIESLGDKRQPVFYRVALRCPSGVDRGRVIRLGRELELPLGEGFRSINKGRSPQRYLESGPLGESERAGETLVLLDPGVFRTRSSGEIGEKLQSILLEFPKK